MRAACANHCLTPVVAALLLSLSLPRSALCGRGSEVFAAASHTTDSASRQLRAAQDHSGDSSWGIATNPTIAGSGLGVKGGKADSSENFRLRRSCGTGPLTAKQMEREAPRMEQAARLMAQHAAGQETRLLDNKPGTSGKQVNVYWHIIQSGGANPKGALTTSAINDQMNVLNRLYATTGIQFNLTEVDTTTNSDWFKVQQDSNADSAMKHALHKGSMEDLNVYSASPRGTLGQQIAGYTKLPQFSAKDPVLDGSVILYSTLPGGQQYELDLGFTLVHEFGHAFGLHHPFDNGCTAPGDNIGDTPYMAEALYTCATKKSCPGTPGAHDPVHNPMGYAPDACMTKFTSQQNMRMRKSFWAYRKPLPVS